MRSYPERPVVGVGAVIVDGDHVLLVRRGHAPLKGEWSLPGGAVELGETLETALRREVLEETSLEVDVRDLIEVVDRIHHSADGRVEYHYVVVDYLCSARAATASSGSDADDVRWAHKDELSAYRLTEAALRVIHKALELSVANP